MPLPPSPLRVSSPDVPWMSSGAACAAAEKSVADSAEPPEPVITSFSCTNDPIEENGHSYNRLYGHWTLAGSSTGVAWQTQVTASTTPPSWGSYPNYLATGTSGTTGWLGQYRNDVAAPTHLYFWVKYYPNSTWEMLGPIDTTDPAACIAFEEEFTFPKALSTMMR